MNVWSDIHVLRQGLGITVMMALITWLHPAELDWDSRMKRRSVGPDLNAGGSAWPPGDRSWLGYDFGLLDIWGRGFARWKSDPWPKLFLMEAAVGDWCWCLNGRCVLLNSVPCHCVCLFFLCSTKNLRPQHCILCLYPQSRYEKYFNQFFQPADCLPNCSPADVCKCN